MSGDHVQFGDGKAVIRRGGTRLTCPAPDQRYVMPQMLFEIYAIGSDLENVARVVLYNRVVPSGARQTALDGLICIAARRGGLCQPQREQQGRCSDR